MADTNDEAIDLARGVVANWAGREPGGWLAGYGPLISRIATVLQHKIDAHKTAVADWSREVYNRDTARRDRDKAEAERDTIYVANQLHMKHGRAMAGVADRLTAHQKPLEDVVRSLNAELSALREQWPLWRQDAAQNAYQAGHNDTVEGVYGDPEETAQDICQSLDDEGETALLNTPTDTQDKGPDHE